MSRALYWFTHDLRLADNEGVISLLSSNNSVAFIYVIDPDWFRPLNYSQTSMGVHRWLFLRQSIEDLHNQLIAKGQSLQVVVGNSANQISKLVRDHNVTALYTAQQFGLYERHSLERVKAICPSLQVYSCCTNTLFTKDQIDEHSIPMQSFSAFRKHVESNDYSVKEDQTQESSLWEAKRALLPLQAKNQFNKVLDDIEQTMFRPHAINTLNKWTNEFVGGEQHACEHLSYYFSSSAPLTYKKTRNQLEGKCSSTGFSPYLAIGNLSPRQVWHALRRYEKQNLENESTYWVGFELLWREYFQWLLNDNPKAFFMFKGLANKKPLTSFYTQRFAQWCNGRTNYPLVNACMNQLNATGYISNRGRQIVASCLVNELSVDWRYGAAYFQKQLIDYDVASNWGNWQYIAGVGVDPRGGRHFNIEKQTQLHDEKNAFINKWQGNLEGEQTYDLTDAADWPVK
ncbi:Cryptochrome DASH [Pseudoalteromonas holothuriae]|uniref:Cryptochrome DASH n=1 Tax=Pseudoalteromonas holothuriae TaxID=2963714 RepID=A0ABN8UQY8_9GAMM|nr:DASH family cryptochrome [Pseudoalteromonas sp. CIP111951]CAH9062205.1 Cryptochrome DASH [Pseudoalteromonas sp. CIP111951]